MRGNPGPDEHRFAEGADRVDGNQAFGIGLRFGERKQADGSLHIIPIDPFEVGPDDILDGNLAWPGGADEATAFDEEIDAIGREFTVEQRSVDAHTLGDIGNSVADLFRFDAVDPS